jgi:hypothetical protein
MARRNQSWLMTALPPILSVCILAAALAETRRRVQPGDAEPFHKLYKAAIEQIPRVITNESSTWYGKDEAIPVSAAALLKPNEIINRVYQESRPGAVIGRGVDLLIVQCKDARDMEGHYPPRCYPAEGDTLVRSEPRDWVIPDRISAQGRAPGMTISGMEYEFSQVTGVENTRRVVYNFFLIPGFHNTLRDIEAVYKAGEDYQRRYYGAAQVQLVMPAELSREERDDVLQQLIGPYVDVLRVLQSGGIGS